MDLMSILVVDDERSVHEALQYMLEWSELGYAAPDSAMNGDEALEMLKQKRYHVLIADIQMPGMDGFSLIKTVQAIQPDLQILIISGYSYFDYAQKALRYGVRDYLLKPIDRHELRDIMLQLSQELQQASGGGDVSDKDYQDKDTIAQVKRYVDSCFRSEITVSGLAARFYLSAPYLGQQFKRATGMSISDYINRRRIEWVKNHLVNRGGYIQETIHRAGYNSSGYFYRKFQEIEGVSFQVWKQSHRPEAEE